MKKRSSHPLISTTRRPLADAARTGEHCPSNGWWGRADNSSGVRLIAEGSIMPPHSGESVIWILMAAELSSHQPKYDYPEPAAFTDFA
ncbi:hypothetical protein [Arthrobacter sp. 18067]|uniref:hypothetical protein n=1 Tax=Arthrobacter sp. 18067 TaxID=2681413 RepID=UPI0013576FBC|nr:hypothetical protein [Arthrobacter sp. 18067]